MTRNPIQRANGLPLTLKKAASANFRGGSGSGVVPKARHVPTAAQRAALAAQVR